MPWCPPELRPLKVRRVKVNEPLLNETYSKLIGRTFSGTYMGTYQVPEAHRLDERRVHRGTIEIADKEMGRVLKGVHDVVDTVTFWSGISLPTEQWRAGSCLPGEARIQLESWRPLFTL